MIIYLHGFNSSALSGKAQQTLAYCARHNIACVAPSLKDRPAKMAEQIERLLQEAEGESHTLVGSSMGGFIATYFCERLPRLRGVLINPAVHLAELLKDEAGKTQTNYSTGEQYLFTPQHLQEFASMDTQKITNPARYFLLAQKGDELLDYKQAETFYAGAKTIVEEGGNHSFEDYERHLPAIAAFAASGAAGQ